MFLKCNFVHTWYLFKLIINSINIKLFYDIIKISFLSTDRVSYWISFLMVNCLSFEYKLSTDHAWSRWHVRKSLKQLGEKNYLIFLMHNLFRALFLLFFSYLSHSTWFSFFLFFLARKKMRWKINLTWK